MFYTIQSLALEIFSRHHLQFYVMLLQLGKKTFKDIDDSVLRLWACRCPICYLRRCSVLLLFASLPIFASFFERRRREEEESRRGEEEKKEEIRDGNCGLGGGIGNDGERTHSKEDQDSVVSSSREKEFWTHRQKKRAASCCKLAAQNILVLHVRKYAPKTVCCFH